MTLNLSRIGQLLKETRESKGLTVEEVSVALYLRKSMVEALESGNREKLPHEVYVKGYLNQYASFLGIEDNLVQQAVESCSETGEASGVTSGDMKDNLSRLHYRPVKEVLRGKHPTKRFAVYGIAVGILVAFFAYQNIHGPHSLPTPAGTYAVSNTGYESTVKPPDGLAPVLELKKLVIACQERTWVRIVIDQAEKKEFMLNPEEMVAFNAKEGFDLLIGNAGGVTLFYNGKDVGFHGENGEVKRVRLP